MTSQDRTLRSLSYLVPIYAGALLVGVIFGVLSALQFRRTAATMEEALTEHAEAAFAAEGMMTLNEQRGRASRSYLLTGEARFLDELQSSRQEFWAAWVRARSQLPDAEAARLLDRVKESGRKHEAEVDRAIRLRQTSGSADSISPMLTQDVQPLRDEITNALATLVGREQGAFDEARRSAIETGTGGFRLLAVAAVLAGLIAATLLLVLVRAVRRLRDNRRALDASVHRLEEKNRDLDAFAGRIAHDLRNVVAPLGMTAVRLIRSSAGNEVMRTSGERVQRISEHVDAWVGSLLAFARSDRVSDPNAAASVKAVVEEVLDSLSTQRALVEAEVEAHLEDDVVVTCPGPLLHIAVMNIVGNAYKFLEGRALRRVVIVASRSASLGEIVVSDTGPGIARDAHEKVFEPFYRTGDTKALGTGLGLATSRRIVEAHGGRISVDSSPDHGARFMIRLPLAEGGRQMEPPRSLLTDETRLSH